MDKPPEQKPELPSTPALGLAHDELNKALISGDALRTYRPYAEWLGGKPQGYLYLQQAIFALGLRLWDTRNKIQMRQAVDGLIALERSLSDT